jgi:ATP-dependent DNA helicase RecG
LKWVKNGEIPILIGTHAIMYKSVEFKHLALAIIDEQHRFGTNQRKALAKKDARMPHLLSMTATPIPRTLALTVYGDLDITLLDEMPKGRKPIITKLVTKDKQEAMYEHVKSELDLGRQAYVICPRIDEPDPEKETAIIAKSVVEEAKRLKEKVFKDKRIGILHSKMKPAEKEKVMLDFSEHKLDILVATSVVEVGVNVPNATNIIIEGAERFGLAQLHQLRGRVIRSTYQAYCFAVSESKSEKTRDRLKALTTAKNGFELAEYDLTFRGSGELYGAKQSGLTDLGMEALKNMKLVEAARNEARELVEKDPELKEHPQVRERVEHIALNLHME